MERYISDDELVYLMRCGSEAAQEVLSLIHICHLLLMVSLLMVMLREVFYHVML